MEHLTDEANRRGQQCDKESGRKKRWSAREAAAIMINRAHAACRSGHITDVLLFDIQAAFPNMAKGKPVNLMMVRKMNGYHIAWTRRCHSERMVGMIIEGNSMAQCPVEAGVKQGTPGLRIRVALHTSGVNPCQIGRRIGPRQSTVFWRQYQLGGTLKRCRFGHHDT
jgi:hypothetical protein